jgi:opacity protein-like surface antigen
MRAPSTFAISLLALACVCSCAAVPAPVAPEYNSSFQTTAFIEVGQRSLDSSFEPVSDSNVWGLVLDIRQPRDSTGLELGFYHSSEDKTEDVGGVGKVDFNSASSELFVGGRWKAGSGFGRLQPVFGAGVSAIVVDYSADPRNGESQSASDWSFGPYVHGGVEYPLGDHFLLVLDYRQLFWSEYIHELDLDGVNSDANYHQITFSIGYTF